MNQPRGVGLIHPRLSRVTTYYTHDNIAQRKVLFSKDCAMASK